MSVIDRLPDHLKTRKTAEAVTAPSAVVLAGAGTAAGILIGARLDAGVLECYRIARRGAALETGLAGLQTGVAWTDLMAGLDAFRVPAELRERVQQGEGIRDHPALA